VFKATTNKAAMKITTKKTPVVKEVRHASKWSRGWAWVWLLILYVFFDVLNVFLNMFPIAHLFDPRTHILCPKSFALSSILVNYI
jgi:hypothetical protein